MEYVNTSQTNRNLPQRRNHGNTFTLCIPYRYLAHPTQLRDIRDKLLASPISYLHFITGVRVICTAGVSEIFCYRTAEEKVRVE